MENDFVLKITIGLLVLVILSEIVVYHPYFKYSPNFEIETYKINSLNSTLTINYKISGSIYSSKINVDFLIAQKTPNNNKTIYIYYDPKYQMALVDKKAVNGIINHLIAELTIRNYPFNKIKVVNATELKHIVLNVKSAKKSIIIIPTGAFPDTVYTKEKNLIKPWIEHGGILIWTTGQFGYYSARNISKPLDIGESWHPKDDGQKYFFGKIIIVKNKRFKEGRIPTQYAKALKLSYKYVYRGVSLSAIQALNGIALGYIDPDSGAVSIASIPLGYGKVIIFGGDIISGPQSLKFVRILSHDIAQIIASGVLDSNLIMYKEYYIKNYKTLKDSINIKIPKHMSSGVLIIDIFESDNEGTYFKKIILHFDFKNGGGMIEKSHSYNNRLT